MNRQRRSITDRELWAWLAAGSVDRGVGEGLTFVARLAAAHAGKASWILRYRFNGRAKEKVLGRYPELSLKDARELARQDFDIAHQQRIGRNGSDGTDRRGRHGNPVCRAGLPETGAPRRSAAVRVRRRPQAASARPASAQTLTARTAW